MDTIENAIKHLKVRNFTGKQVDMAIEALEKQLPKDVINKQTQYVKYCPVCDSALLRENDVYCSDCGQKLQWDL